MMLAEREELLRQHPGHRKQLETWFVLGQQTAWRATTGAGAEGPETHHQLLARWQEQREALEPELERRVPALARQRRWLNLEAPAVAAVLPAESVLIEYVRYQPRDFAGLCAAKEAKGPARYVAFVLDAGRPEDVRLVDLGEAAPIDSLARAARSLLRRRHARALLGGLVLAPLAPACGGSRHVIIAASGPLARVRFAELPGGSTVRRQVTTGRELLDLPAAVSVPESAGWLRRLWRPLRRREPVPGK
jgi:hypothetical protein